MKTKNESRRRRRSVQKNDRDRYLRLLQKEENQLFDQVHNAPLRLLEEPYQRGWERFFVLSDEARRRRDAEHMEKALYLVRNYQRCRLNPFKHYSYRKKKNIPWRHYLQGLRPSEILRKNIPLELMKYFQVNKKKPITRRYLRELVLNDWRGNFWFRYPEYAVSKIQPHWVTHQRIILPEVSRRLAEIEKELDSPVERGRLCNLHGYSLRRWDRYNEKKYDRREERWIKKEMDLEVLSLDPELKIKRFFMKIFKSVLNIFIRDL